MSASQLLRILQTLPVGAADNEICAFNTDELETNVNRISKSTNPFLSDDDNDKLDFWNNPELETSIFTNEFTNNITNRFYIDKHSVECELPELMVCYKESNFRVKDVCDDQNDMIEANLDTEFVKDEWLRSSTVRGCCYMGDELNLSVQNKGENCGPESLMYNRCDEKLDFRTDLQNYESRDQRLPSDYGFSVREEWSLTSLEFPESSNIHSDDGDPQPLQGSKEEFSETAIVGYEIEKLSRNEQMMDTLNETKMQGSVAFRFDAERAAKTDDPCLAMNPETIFELPLETESGLDHQDVAPGKVTVANHERRYTRGESSFSMAGVISELISCSGPMPFAGGLSSRSDSSATSNTSFAFPTLDSEYVSSPTRMGKSERRRLSKRWRQSLCCKF